MNNNTTNRYEYYFQKVIEKVVKTPQLHGHFGTLTQYNPNKEYTLVYFIRKHSEGVHCPDMMEEAESEMPHCFQVGITNGDLLASVINFIPNVSIIYNCF